MSDNIKSTIFSVDSVNPEAIQIFTPIEGITKYTVTAVGGNGEGRFFKYSGASLEYTIDNLTSNLNIFVGGDGSIPPMYIMMILK